MDTGPRAALLADRYRLAQLVSRARWATIAFGCVEALLADPPPISRAGLVIGLVVAALYNVPASMPRRFSPAALERLLLLALAADFLAISNAVALAANAPYGNQYLLWVLPGLEAALLYQARGAAAFSAAFVTAFSLWVAEREAFFGAPTTAGDYLFGALTMLIVAGFAGGMAVIAHRSTLFAVEQAERLAAQADELGRLYHDAHASHGQLSDFLHALVHEMRSPLTVITGYADLLRDPRFAESDAGEGALRAIGVKAEALNAIVDELLLTARVESGRLTLDSEPVDVAEAAEAACGRAADRARLVDGTVDCSAVDSPSLALGDGTAIARILDNLVGNALLYAGPSPRVEVTAGAADGECWVRVRDHGPGIPEALHQRVFERFVRADESGHRQGSGLGLYLARTLARRMEGELTLEPSDQGACFRLSLPLAALDVEEAADTAELEASPRTMA